MPRGFPPHVDYYSLTCLGDCPKTLDGGRPCSDCYRYFMIMETKKRRKSRCVYPAKRSRLRGKLGLTTKSMLLLFGLGERVVMHVYIWEHIFFVFTFISL
jgi:hypothetical protein